MSDLSFEQMLEETIKTIHTGEIVVGKIIDVKEDLAVLNVGYKSDGILTRNEYSNDAALDLRTVLHVGDELEVKVLKVNDGEGQLILSYKRIAQDKAKRRLEEAFENHEVLKAKVSQVVSGGICIDVDGNRVFVPASLVSDTYEKDLGKYQDQEIEFVITECNPRRKRIIGDRKQLIVARKIEKTKAIEIAKSALDRVGLSDRYDYYPSKLSGGQQQRVGIARAIAASPKLILFDEPTSALDTELVGEVLKVMKKLAEDGVTMVVVSHEIDFAREVANKVMFIDEGRVIEEGIPKEVLNNPKELRTRQFLSRVLHKD